MNVVLNMLYLFVMKVQKMVF